jgi:hypothetical protein
VNTVLRRIFLQKRQKATGGWRDYRFKSMRRMEHIARMGRRRNTCKILVGKPEGKRPLVDISIDGRIKLRWILKK